MALHLVYMQSGQCRTTPVQSDSSAPSSRYSYKTFLGSFATLDDACELMRAWYSYEFSTLADIITAADSPDLARGIVAYLYASKDHTDRLIARIAMNQYAKSENLNRSVSEAFRAFHFNLLLQASKLQQEPVSMPPPLPAPRAPDTAAAAPATDARLVPVAARSPLPVPSPTVDIDRAPFTSPSQTLAADATAAAASASAAASTVKRYRSVATATLPSSSIKPRDSKPVATFAQKDKETLSEVTEETKRVSDENSITTVYLAFNSVKKTEDSPWVKIYQKKVGHAGTARLDQNLNMIYNAIDENLRTSFPGFEWKSIQGGFKALRRSDGQPVSQTDAQRIFNFHKTIFERLQSSRDITEKGYKFETKFE